MGKGKLKNINYWSKRSLDREVLAQAKANLIVEDMQKAYDRAFFNIEKELTNAYVQLEKKGGKDAEDAEAYIARISRMERMQEVIYREFSELARIEIRKTEDFYKELIADSYFRAIFDIQKGTGLGFSFALIPKNAINEILSSKWKGRNFKDSVWKNTGKVAEYAREIVLSGITSGASIEKMFKQLEKYELHALKDTAKYVTERLIRTETNYFMNQGELLAYKECDIERYRYVAVLDNRTSKLCQELDLKVFKIKDAVVGVNYPPMHPNCRSTTIAVIDGYTLEGLERRARDPNTGKTYLIPADISYSEWEKTIAA